MKNSEIVHDLLQVNRELPIGPKINQDTLTRPSQNLSLDVGLQPYDLLIKTIFSKRNFVIVHPQQGDKGAQGFIGSRGKEGLPGLPGLNGYKGDRGENGFNGLPGIKGNKGEMGPMGWPGEKGIQGPQGKYMHTHTYNIMTIF